MVAEVTAAELELEQGNGSHNLATQDFPFLRFDRVQNCASKVWYLGGIIFDQARHAYLE